MSSIGSSTESSTSAQTARDTAESTKRPPTRADVQPHALPSVSASRSEPRPSESSTAPGTSSFDSVLIGDSGTNRQIISGRDADAERADDEEPAPREVVHDQAREDEPQAAADREDGGDDPDGAADLLRRKLVLDDREAEREHRAADALDGAGADERPDVPREDRQHAAEEEDAHADQQQPLLPVLVAELAEDRRGDGGHEQEAGQEPGHPGRGRVQVALERRQRRDDHRLLERVGDPAGGQGGQGDVVVPAPGVGAPS